MISLWLSLAVLVLLALAFMMWPLWRFRRSGVEAPRVSEDEIEYRLAENVRLFREHLTELESHLAIGAIDAQQLAQLKLELERNLLNDEQSLRAILSGGSLRVKPALLVVFFAIILLSSGLLYHRFGSAGDVHIHALQQEKMQLDYQDVMQNRDPNPARSAKFIEELQASVKARPDNIQNWFLLARTAMQMRNYTLAVDAYQQVYAKDTRAPIIMAELAQATFLRDGNKMSPPIAELAKKAVALDPTNTMALGLLGIDSFANKDFRQAILYWQQAIAALGEDSGSAQSLMAGIERAKQEYVNAGGKLDELTAKSKYAVEFSVNLGSNAKVDGDQIVFIYARAWKGSPMPLAIKRVKVSELPTKVLLDETMAMSPMASLATATDIEIVARISKEGTAKASVGDWQAQKGPLSMASLPTDLSLVIDEQVTAESLSTP